MNLREWNSNCLEFLEGLPDGERSTIKEVTKVLGLLWNPVEDTVSVPGFDYVPTPTFITKRDVLHSVAKIFDPLGPIRNCRLLISYGMIHCVLIL